MVTDGGFFRCKLLHFSDSVHSDSAHSDVESQVTPTLGVIPGVGLLRGCLHCNLLISLHRRALLMRTYAWVISASAETTTTNYQPPTTNRHHHLWTVFVFGVPPERNLSGVHSRVMEAVGSSSQDGARAPRSMSPCLRHVGSDVRRLWAPPYFTVATSTRVTPFWYLVRGLMFSSSSLLFLESSLLVLWFSLQAALDSCSSGVSELQDVLMPGLRNDVGLMQAALDSCSSGVTELQDVVLPGLRDNVDRCASGVHELRLGLVPKLQVDVERCSALSLRLNDLANRFNDDFRTLENNTAHSGSCQVCSSRGNSHRDHRGLQVSVLWTFCVGRSAP